MFADAVRHHRAGELDAAQQLCRAILVHEPKHVQSLVLIGSAAQRAGRNQAAIKVLREALAIDDCGAAVHDAIAMAYQGVGQHDDAVRHFTQAIARGLGSVEQLIKQAPVIAASLERLQQAWPRRLTLAELLGADDVGAIAHEALFVGLLRSRPVCDVALERLLTALRFALLQRAIAAQPSPMAGAALEFCCALAQQCFVNEYVFAASDTELGAAQRLRERVATLVDAGSEFVPLQLAVVGTYFPLHALPVTLTGRSWPQKMEHLITQQVREPQQEARDRPAIAALTRIEDGMSLEVQQQYEENPYPRWIMAMPVTPTTLDDYLRKELPIAPTTSVVGANSFDILIAGCGTGQHSIERALRFPQARLLAIDLSRASLAYARRKTREAGLTNIEYGHADILELGAIGRSFDVIEAAGSLQVMSDPFAGWRALLPLLRRNGLMFIGLYSAAARRAVTAFRASIAERGLRATAEDIRAFRQDLISRGQAPSTVDFFSTSGCRDFLFNVIEHQHTIPQIKAFLDDNALNFLGFELSADAVRQFQQDHADPAALLDLDRWHAFELSHPRTFAMMYAFWVQTARD